MSTQPGGSAACRPVAQIEGHLCFSSFSMRWKVPGRKQLQLKNSNHLRMTKKGSFLHKSGSGRMLSGRS